MKAQGIKICDKTKCPFIRLDLMEDSEKYGRCIMSGCIEVYGCSELEAQVDVERAINLGWI